MKTPNPLVLAILGAALSLGQAASAQEALERLERQLFPQAQAPLPQPERGFLGFTTDDRADAGRGARVIKLRPGGPAEKAGLKVNDLITAAGGAAVRTNDDLAPLLRQAAPGARIAFD
ncbi:MAG: PDZ domain-containing protein, partial [Planctomycetia bacterium]|nr:PDZ domain-containing protein [Planctomycetia bacterium]